MTTLDGVERSFDAETVLVCDRDGPTGIAGIMGGQVSEVSDDDDPGAARGRDLERGQHPAHLAQARAALRGLEPVREAAPPRAGDPRPAGRLAADGRALRRAARPGHDRRRRRDPGRRTGSGCAAAARRRAARDADRAASDAPSTSSGSGSRSSPTATTSRPTVPVHRHYDVTREVDLIEEVGRIHGYDEHLPATLPDAREQGGGLDPRAAPAPPRRGRDPRPRLRRRSSPEPRSTRRCAERLRLAGRRPARAPIAIRNPLSSEHSALRTTLLGGLLDAARYNLARGAERVALFESGRAYLRRAARRADGGARRQLRRASGPRPRTSRTGSAAWPAGRCAGGGWRGEARPSRLLRAQGRARGARGAARRRARGRAGAPSRSCTRAAPARIVRRRRAPPAGSASCTRSSPRLGPRRRRRVRARPGAAGRRLADRRRAATRT